MGFGAECRSDELFRAERISKSYGHIPILHDVSLVVPPRSIVGLVGENGAGKTTLFNILTGLARPDSGAMSYRGERYSPRAYDEACALGISRVFQEQALILNVPVYENLVLSQEHRFTKFGQLIDRTAMIKVAERIIDDAGLDVDVRRDAGTYDFSKRQAIEIARACMAPRHLMGIADPLVLLDEPTSALDRQDERRFIELLARMRKHASFVFVSHRLTEVREICDTIHVMKDGRLSGPLDPATADEKVLHGLMVGRERADDYYHIDRQGNVDGRPVIFRRSPGHWRFVGFGKDPVRQSRCRRASAGQRHGRVLGEAPPRKPNIRDFVRDGLGYVPAERLVEGIIPSLSLAVNLSLPSADRFSPYGLWRLQKERAAAVAAIRQFGIRSGSPLVPLQNLSGGNQQKVVLARWLQRNLKALVLDNPTRGVDAGAKEEIYQSIRLLTEQGVGVILITDELTELIGMTNRILIMQRGRIVAELPAPPDAKPAEHDLIPHMLPSAA
jgi:ribose transport system ATP-binding protein